jgi:hypothetical protein
LKFKIKQSSAAVRGKAKEISLNQVCWCMPVIPKIERLKQEDRKFEASLDYKMCACMRESFWHSNMFK